MRGKIIEQEGTEQKKSQRNLRKKKIKEKLGKLQARTKERFQEQEQLGERKNFKEKVTDQNELIEGFKNVVDDLGDRKIKMRGDSIEGMKIELIRKGIEASCDK